MRELIGCYRTIAELQQSQKSLTAAIPEALASLSKLTGSTHISVWLKEGNSLVCVSQLGQSREKEQRITLSQPGHPLALACKDGSPEWTVDPVADGIRYLLPLRWHGELLGLLMLAYSAPASESTSQLFPAASEMVSRLVADFETREKLTTAQQSLEERLAELQTIFNVSPIGIAISADPKCERIRVNPAAAKMLGVSTAEYYSKTSAFGKQLSFKVLHEGKELANADLPIQRAARDGAHSSELKIDIVHDDGRIFNLFEYASPLRDEHGNLRGAIGFFVDVTPLHKAEESLRSRLEDLAAADENKNHVLAVIAHELRNPLSAISSAAQILNRPALNQHHEWALERLGRQVRTMSRLVEDLLDASRVGRNQVKLDLQPVDLRVVMKHSQEAVSTITAEKHQRVTVELPDEPLFVCGDTTRLEQVLGNVLVNAAKYSDENGSIAASLREEAGWAVITVTDAGIGIEKELLPRVFDNFMQVLPGSERSRGGLGLGLNLVKRFVELHGGNVSAHSDGPGCGSKFTIRIPLLEAKELARPSPAYLEDAKKDDTVPRLAMLGKPKKSINS